MLSSLLLAGAPVFAQELAAALPAKPDCAPDEPDSLQISWMAPCEAGSWLFDPEAGCRMWDWHPEPNDKATWSGACLAALPQGAGVVQWSEHRLPIDRFEGTYRKGLREGFGRYAWNKNVHFEGHYAGDVPQGHGVLRVDDDTLAGEWKNGCLSVGGRVAAIGVPRQSCPDGGDRRENLATF